MTLTWAKAAHETIVRAATAINVVRKVFIVNAPFRKPASFRNRSERARRFVIAQFYISLRFLGFFRRQPRVILNDTRELTIDELEMVSGGSFLRDVCKTVCVGVLTQATVTIVTEAVLDAAKNHK
jgi:hypothetical protein